MVSLDSLIDSLRAKPQKAMSKELIVLFKASDIEQNIDNNISETSVSMSDMSNNNSDSNLIWILRFFDCSAFIWRYYCIQIDKIKFGHVGLPISRWYNTLLSELLMKAKIRYNIVILY